MHTQVSGCGYLTPAIMVSKYLNIPRGQSLCLLYLGCKERLILGLGCKIALRYLCRHYFLHWSLTYATAAFSSTCILGKPRPVTASHPAVAW